MDKLKSLFHKGDKNESPAARSTPDQTPSNAGVAVNSNEKLDEGVILHTRYVHRNNTWKKPTVC